MSNDTFLWGLLIVCVVIAGMGAMKAPANTGDRAVNGMVNLLVICCVAGLLFYVIMIGIGAGVAMNYGIDVTGNSGNGMYTSDQIRW